MLKKFRWHCKNCNAQFECASKVLDCPHCGTWDMQHFEPVITVGRIVGAAVGVYIKYDGGTYWAECANAALEQIARVNNTTGLPIVALTDAEWRALKRARPIAKKKVRRTIGTIGVMW